MARLCQSTTLFRSVLFWLLLKTVTRAFGQEMGGSRSEGVSGEWSWKKGKPTQGCVVMGAIPGTGSFPPTTPNFSRIADASQTGSVHPKAGRQSVYPSVSHPLRAALGLSALPFLQSEEDAFCSMTSRDPQAQSTSSCQKSGGRQEGWVRAHKCQSPGSNHLWSQVCFRDKTLNHCSTKAPGRNTISPLPQIAISPLPPSDSLQKFSLEAFKLPDLISVVNGLSRPHGCPMGFSEETRGLKGWGDICRAAMETQTLRTDLWTWLGLWGGRRGWDEWRELHGNILPCVK